jgi:hypothetical protein
LTFKILYKENNGKNNLKLKTAEGILPRFNLINVILRLRSV